MPAKIADKTAATAPMKAATADATIAICSGVHVMWGSMPRCQHLAMWFGDDPAPVAVRQAVTTQRTRGAGGGKR